MNEPNQAQLIALASQTNLQAAANAAMRASMATQFMVALLPAVVKDEEEDALDSVAVLDQAADLAVAAADRLIRRLQRGPDAERHY